VICGLWLTDLMLTIKGISRRAVNRLIAKKELALDFILSYYEYEKKVRRLICVQKVC